MISETEALDRILGSIARGGLGQTSCPLLDALSLRCASTLTASIALPGFDNSMMDGYAVRASETLCSETPLAVVGAQPAGRDLGLVLTGPRQAIRIFTGAPLPSGCDAVIMQEDVVVAQTSTNGEPSVIRCLESVQPGENLRHRGSDLCPGQILAHPGELITPGVIGLLASQGLTRVPVFQTPRVAVLSTGDELVPPGHSSPLQPGELYNSNGMMLAALLRDCGMRDVELTHCLDSLEATRDTLAQLSAQNDVILLSGGVSVGDRDFVKPALTALGLPPQLWRIRVKPGKPFLFTHRPASPTHPALWVFGLPGNPVSAFVTFQLFVRPALLKLAGTPDASLSLPIISAALAQPLANHGDRPHYIRGQVRAGEFHAGGLQRSDALFALSRANALLRLDCGTSLEAGTEVEVFEF